MFAPGSDAHNSANALRMKTELALRENSIIDAKGRLTEYAISKSQPALSRDSSLENPKVITELTKNGSNIKDWTKMTTPSIELSTGQRVQVHYYKNKITGEINYNIDYKVKNEVWPFPKVPGVEPKVAPYHP